MYTSTTQCVDTDASGNYTISDVAPGEQVLNVREDGYIPVNDQLVTVTAGETASQPIPMSPELAEGELRIVLTWGVDPKDLDSYLLYPSQSNGPIRHNNTGLGVELSPRLDLDDRDGNGPETITIQKLVNGTYSYAVKRHAGNGSIATSNAVVRVYRGDEEIRNFSAPTGTGDWWHVFNLDGATGEITEVNRLQNESPVE